MEKSSSLNVYQPYDANTLGLLVPATVYYGPWSGFGCFEVLVLICHGGQFRLQVRNAQNDVVCFTGFSVPSPAIVHGLIWHNHPYVSFIEENQSKVDWCGQLSTIRNPPGATTGLGLSLLPCCGANAHSLFNG